jgi:hypothetical protein
MRLRSSCAFRFSCLAVWPRSRAVGRNKVGTSRASGAYGTAALRADFNPDIPTRPDATENNWHHTQTNHIGAAKDLQMYIVIGLYIILAR